MSTTHVGNDGSTLVIQPGFPIKRQTPDAKWEIEFLYWTAKDGAEALLPSPGAASTEAGHTGLLLQDVEIFPSEDPTAVFVRLIYRDPDVILRQVGTTIRESEAAIQEVPIEHKTGLTDPEKATLKAAGVKSFIVPSVTYSRTTFSSSFTFTEANLVDGVGLIDNAPTGMTAPTANRWLKTALTVRKAGSDVEVRNTWMYDTNGWSTVLYT